MSSAYARSRCSVIRAHSCCHSSGSVNRWDLSRCPNLSNAVDRLAASLASNRMRSERRFSAGALAVGRTSGIVCLAATTYSAPEYRDSTIGSTNGGTIGGGERGAGCTSGSASGYLIEKEPAGVSNLSVPIDRLSTVFTSTTSLFTVLMSIESTVAAKFGSKSSQDDRFRVHAFSALRHVTGVSVI